MKLYLAGPLFTLAERHFNAALASSLRNAGHMLFVPQEHPETLAVNAFFNDRHAIKDCDGVVANMDGPDPDSGTCWEVGFAHALRKPTVLFRTDYRRADDLDAPFNLMPWASAWSVINGVKYMTIDQLADRLDQELRLLPPVGE